MSHVVVIGGPWPERIGCRGITVDAPEGYAQYPWAGLGKHDVVILLDADPLGSHRPADFYGGQAWTCVMSTQHLAFVTSRGAA